MASGPPSVLVQLVGSWTHTARVDSQDVIGVPAAGKDQLLHSDELEENLPPKAGEEESREWGGWVGGHCVSIAANLPRCKMINPSW